MKLGQYFNYCKKLLSEEYDTREAENIAHIIFEHATGLSKVDRLLRKDQEMTENKILQIAGYMSKLQQHIPLQYVLEEAWFYNFRLKIDENVLIPRPETEELVDWVIKDVKKNNSASKIRPLRLLDIGTGSGCIAIALKMSLPDWNVDAIDVNPAALGMAMDNSRRLTVDVNFQQDDILNPRHLGSYPFYDIIISNPPYIPENDKIRMARNVADHEPALALFVPDNDPLIFYKAIADFAGQRLKDGGNIYLEINEAFGLQTAEVFKQMDFQRVTVQKDMQGKDRMIKAVK